MLNPQVHAQIHTVCVQYLRAAIAEGDPEFISHVAGIIRGACRSGHTSPDKICDDLTPTEQKQWKLWFARFVR